MPRQSSRAAPASPQAPEAAPKRRASTRLSTSQPEIKRVKSNASLPGKPVKSTAKKSKYFEPESSKEPSSPSSESGGDESDSAYEEDKAFDVSSEHDSVPDEPSESEEDSKKSHPKGRRARTATTDKELLKGKELWREGVRTGLGPGKEVFIPKPKARDPGNVPYRDERLHPNTKLFLQDLAKNNDREWFKGKARASHHHCIAKRLLARARLPDKIMLTVPPTAHDPDYRAAKKDFETFVETLTTKIAEKDSTIPELPVKDLVRLANHTAAFSSSPARVSDQCMLSRYFVSTAIFALVRIHFRTRYVLACMIGSPSARLSLPGQVIRVT